jgi:uncharacterized membrane-anchored protein
MPADDPQRLAMHNELHARPAANIALSAMLVYVAVNNEGLTREPEHAHLCRVPCHAELTLQHMADNFARLPLRAGELGAGQECTLKWARHTDYTRYSLVMPVPELHWPAVDEAAFAQRSPLPEDWFSNIPGQTIGAIRALMLTADIAEPDAVM